jgi:hypothetical protein
MYPLTALAKVVERAVEGFSMTILRPQFERSDGDANGREKVAKNAKKCR